MSFHEARKTGCKPTSLWRSELLCPFVDCIFVAHTAVTPRTNRDKVVKRRLATPAFGNVVTALIVEYGNSVAAPRDTALSLKAMPHPRNPNLLGEGFRNFLLSIGFAWKIAEFHSSSYVM